MAQSNDTILHSFITVKELVDSVNEFCPFKLAYDWDNVGLQTGNPTMPVNRVLVALEVNHDVINFALENNCNVIISHHPLIFKPLKSLHQSNDTVDLLTKLIKSDIALIAAHTNLDRVKNGTNGALAELIKLRDPELLETVSIDQSYNVVVFVPTDYSPKIIEAIHRGGGAQIGNYSHCTFSAHGTGTYKPGLLAQPFSGTIGKLESASEDRLECVVAGRNVGNVIKEIKQAHPYEEVAYNVFPLHDSDPQYGLGLVGTLPSQISLRQFAELSRSVCEAPFAQFAGDGARKVKKIAIVSGSAGSVALKIDPKIADVILTGELSYHITMDCVARGVGVVALGHAVSERVFAPYFCREFAERLKINNHNIDLVPYCDFPEPWQVIQKTTKKK